MRLYYTTRRSCSDHLLALLSTTNSIYLLLHYITARNVLRYLATPVKVSSIRFFSNRNIHPLFVRREWVAKCLGQMTDANRAEAQAELRQVIADAFTAKSLWTTDWAGVQLQRCRPVYFVGCLVVGISDAKHAIVSYQSQYQQLTV